MKIRGTDNYGSGHFGASRGARKHRGIDVVVEPNTEFCCITGGTVTKLGYPYAKDLSYRYVEITDEGGARWRYHYVLPSVELNQKVDHGEPIGTTQELAKMYPNGMTEHVHLEVISGDIYLDPTGLVQDR